MEPCNSGNSCHLNPTISKEQFISDHIFIYLISGSMVIYDGDKVYTLKSGDYGLAKRNYLAKYTKQPDNDTFKAVSVFFSQPFLIDFCKEYSIRANGIATNDGVLRLKSDNLLDHYTQSLTPYLSLDEKKHEKLLLLKYKELVLLLLQTNPEIENVLFDFSDPGKIDLEAFMNRNFRFNVSLKGFAYLTGRSLTTFKRDFERIFHAPPGRWLMEKRLQEACFLIESKGGKPSEVYLEVGFEDLSHFSYAFKQRYGLSPNRFKKVNK